MKNKEDKWIAEVDVDSILENTYYQVYDQVGSAAEGFLDNVTAEQGKELAEQLSNVLYNWIKKHKLEPICLKK